MDNERKTWEQMECEPTLWYGRFVKYLRLGTKRSVNAVYKKEFSSARKGENKRGLEAGGEWYDIEKEWKWKERARAYDEHERAEEDRIIAEERDKVLRSGFALQHKRIKELDRLTRKLIQTEKDDSKVWIVETRTMGIGDNMQTIENVTFNAPLYTLIEKYMNSIAAEMGERVKKKDITLTEMPPNVYQGFDPDQDGVE